jgi:copper(I)-binding protein
MKYSTTLPLVFFLLFSVTATTAARAGKLEIHDAWVREAPPTAEVMAAYLTLHNHSSKAYTLTGVSSPDFERVEMHRTEQHDGMTTMLPVSRVILSTNGSVSFQPGGMHLMLMKPKKHLMAGNSISLTLVFADESSMTITAPVKKATGDDEHAMHHGNHDAMQDMSNMPGMPDMQNAEHDADHHHSH